MSRQGVPPPSQSPPAGKPRRSGWRRLLLAILVVIGVFVVVALVVGAVTSATRETATVEEAVPSGELDALTITGGAGDIEIVAEDREDVVVTTRRTSSIWGEPRVELRVGGGELMIDSECGWVAIECSVGYDVAVPADGLEDVRVDVAAADIDIVGLGADVEVVTDAGNIDVLGFTGSQAVIRASAGNINVVAEQAPRQLEVTTSAGSISIQPG